MGYNPLTGEFEPDEAAPAAPGVDVNEYIKQKFGLGDYSDEKRKAMQEQSQLGFGDKASAAIAALGAGFSGKDPGSAGMGVLNARKADKRQALDDFDKGRANKLQENALGREAEKYGRDEETRMRESDPNSAESKFAQEAAKRMGYKGDLSQVTATKFKGFSPVLEKMYQVEQSRLNRMDQRDFQRSLLDDRKDTKQREAEEKKNEKDLRLAVPGYERTGEVLPKEEEAMKFRKATAVSEQLASKLNQMKDLVKKYGSYEYGGEGGTEMDSLATEIQLLGKSPELYELGVLTGPDLNLLQKITASPSSMDSLFTRDSSRQTQIDSQIKSIQNKLGSTAKSMGYRQAGQGRHIVDTQVNTKTGQTRVVYSDGTTEIKNSTAGQ